MTSFTFNSGIRAIASLETMAETRAQALLKETVAREAEEAIESRFEALEKAIALQNEKMAIQNEKTDHNILEMIEAFCLMSSNINPQGVSTSENRNVDGVSFRNSGTPDIQHEHQHGGRQGMHTNYKGRTRMTRLDFPRFKGEKLKEWLGKAEQFFDIDFTPEESKVGIASLHFEDLAATCHQALMQEDDGRRLLRDWRGYTELLQERFEEVLNDPMAELKELKETEGIDEYHAKFELIRTRLKLSEEYLLSAYLAGLRLETQMHVRMFRPQNTRQCLVLGCLYKKAHPRKTGG